MFGKYDNIGTLLALDNVIFNKKYIFLIFFLHENLTRCFFFNPKVLIFFLFLHLNIC